MKSDSSDGVILPEINMSFGNRFSDKLKKYSGHHIEGENAVDERYYTLLHNKRTF